MKEAVIVAAARTPIGSFGGSLSPLSPAGLGGTAARAVLDRAGIRPDQVEEVLVGNVLSAGHGQNIARQVALEAGIPVEVPAMGISKVCGSGLRSVSLAAQIIRAGDAHIVLAGGCESMSNAPYVMKKHRFGSRMGHDTLTDSMISDGLWDVFNDYHMGMTAENIAEKYKISRQEQDEFALMSQERAAAAKKEGRFSAEIVPVEVPGRKDSSAFCSEDEYIREGTTLEGLSKLKPAFKKEGTVTAGNASGINDGAAMLLICSRDKAKELGLRPLAVIRSYASAGVDPSVMGLGVVPASRLAMKKAGLSEGDIDLVEANEAFAAQAIAVCRDLKFDKEKTNVNGGAIALGHPIGASGARILVTLLYEMERRKAKTGLASLCIGGGMGTAVLVERQEDL